MPRFVSSSVLNLMLPFGSIDETVRLGGSYVIRYQKSSARILEVFYSAPGDQTGLLGGLGCSFSGLTPEGYTALKGYSGEDNKDNRKHYVGPDNNNAVIGWYDGDGLEGSETLAAPSIRVINAERLEVEITNPSADKDSGWKKIRRVKERFELMNRIEATLEPYVGSVNNDVVEIGKKH